MEAFDYVVVGAGSAGCVVARRLSDDAAVSVLLLEAGPPANGFWNRTPAGMAKLHRSPRYNWNFVTEPEQQLAQRKVYWPSGKALGGGSAINGMVYVRGDRRDYDGWARLGNPGWSWEDVLPYFIRSECNSRGTNAIHGVDGPMVVAEPSVIHPTVHDFLAAAQRCGLARHDDFSDGNMSGAGIVQCTIRDGIRESSYDAFIRPVAGRPNLKVETEVQVCRIVVRDGAAVGVELYRDGQRRTVYARHEVVLSAGAISSPHVLMLSGIGDAAELQQQGIAVAAHIPGVGKNLQDHFAVRVQAETTVESSYNRILRGWRKYREGALYLFRKQGFLALATSSAAGFVKSDPALEYADLELSFRPMTFTLQPSGEFEIDPYSAISTSVYRVRPSSRGHIALHTANPFDPPAITANYLTAPDDVRATIAGVRLVRKIFAAQPLAARVKGELIPGPKATSDDELRDYLVRTGGSVFHPAGSCRMGNDAMAVVDSQLRVRGVGRLRVIDASIMPTVVTGNTNAAAIMIGEKGADLVRGRTPSTREALAPTAATS